MGKAAKGRRFYAVARGNGGPQIYEEWPACEKAVHGYPGAMHKSFKTMQEAQDYIQHNSGTGIAMNIDKPQSCSFKLPSGPLYPRTPNLPTGNFAKTPLSEDVKPTISSSFPIKSEYEDNNAKPNTKEYVPRITTRYAPYDQAQSRPLSQKSVKKEEVPTSSIYTYGVVPPPPRPILPFPTSFKPDIASSSSPSLALGSQQDPVEVSSDVEQNSPRKADGQSEVGQIAKPEAMATEMVYPVASTSMLPAATVVEEAPEPPLSFEQQQVLKKVLKGESIFFTGSAGVGKSVLTRAIIKHLQHKYLGQVNAVGVTATTGIASTNIGGCTLHSWAGCGLAKLDVEKLMWSIIKKGKNGADARWKQCKALIVDEVSMLDGEFLDKLEALAKLLRSNSKPFGGIQLILTGDFFQLPPVPNIETGNRKITPTFAFNSYAWSECIKGNIYVLKQVFRQKDQTFVDLLNELRMGNLSQLAIKKFKSLSRKVDYDDGIEPTCLYPLKKMVNDENNRRLRALQAEAMTFKAEDTSGRKKDGGQYYTDDNNLMRALDGATLVERMQTYKVGAQVMLVKNIQSGGGLVNGSIGKIIGFHTKEEVRPSADPMTAEAQGYVPQGYSEEDYLMYAAENDGATLPPPPVKAQPALLNVEVAQEARKPARDAMGRPLEETEASMEIPPGKWPVVEFKTGRRMLLPPMSFTIENAEGRVEASRQQVPLILAWALSIHKSQGQTLERVKVDLGNAFEAGMGYVALSRATKLETLQILRFDPSKIRAHKDVIAWHNKTMQNQMDGQDKNDEW